MKLILSVWLFLISTLALAVDFKSGDLIFQRSLSGQARAIELATGSEFTHMGVVFQGESGRFFVFEAGSLVRLTPIWTWINRGRNSEYVLKRLRSRRNGLSEREISALMDEAQELRGKSYDIYFNWSDDEIYCSELVYKIYDRALGIRIGRIERLRDFDLDHPEVRRIMRQRYGDNIPLNERVISPVSMAQSRLLYTVDSNWN